MAKTIIGVMGPGRPKDIDRQYAYELGELIARNRWTLLTGGRKAGVMDAASRGASEHGGLVIGILPGSDRRGISDYVDIPILTGMGSARNNINVLSSSVVVACGTGTGTTSEIMLALKAGRDVILLNQSEKAEHFFKEMDGGKIHFCENPAHAVEVIKSII